MWLCLITYWCSYIEYTLHANDSIPMTVVHMLSYERVWLHCAIFIHLRHIHVIYEVDQSFTAWGSIVTARFLLQGLFHHSCIETVHGQKNTVNGEFKQNKDSPAPWIPLPPLWASPTSFPASHYFVNTPDWPAPLNQHRILLPADLRCFHAFWHQCYAHWVVPEFKALNWEELVSQIVSSPYVTLAPYLGELLSDAANLYLGRLWTRHLPVPDCI